MIRPKFNSLENLKILENDQILGKGAFSKVIKVLHIETNKKYALKIINLQKVSKLDQKNLKNEEKLHKKLSHPNIIKFQNSIQIKKNLYFLLELAENGSLFYYIHPKKGLPEKIALKLFYQIAKSINYLHKKNICHRDIKPENILIDKNFRIKLADFGWSANMENGEVRTSICGTYEYMSPELIINHCHTNKIDIWALGVLLYEMLHGLTPFMKIREIKKKKFFEDFNYEKFNQNFCEDFNKKLCFKDLEDFFLNEEIFFKQDISKNCFDLLKKMLVFDEVERIDIEDLIKNEVFFNIDENEIFSQEEYGVLMENMIFNFRNKKNILKPSIIRGLTKEDIFAMKMKKHFINPNINKFENKKKIDNNKIKEKNNFKNNAIIKHDSVKKNDNVNKIKIDSNPKHVNIKKIRINSNQKNDNIKKIKIDSNKKIDKNLKNEIIENNILINKNKINKKKDIIENNILSNKNQIIHKKETNEKIEIKIKNKKKNFISRKRIILDTFDFKNNINNQLTIIKEKNNNFEKKPDKKNMLIKYRFLEYDINKKKEDNSISEKSSLSFLTKKYQKNYQKSINSFQTKKNKDSEYGENQTALISKNSVCSFQSINSYFNNFGNFIDMKKINILAKKVKKNNKKKNINFEIQNFENKNNDLKKIENLKTNLIKICLNKNENEVISKINGFNVRKKIIKLDKNYNFKDFKKYQL